MTSVRYAVTHGVAWLTIDRLEAHNALSEEVRKGLFDGVHRFNADDEAKVLVLTGAGEKAFCADGDLKEMSETALTVPPPDFLPQLGRNIDVAKPTIAAVNGIAYGGGFLLAQQCDLVVAAEHARFAVSEVKVGRGSPWAAPLSWLVPPTVAMEILLTGDPISAAHAHRVYRRRRPRRPARRATGRRARAGPPGHRSEAGRRGGQSGVGNAYLGAWGITEGLRADADIVVTGRVTDASVVVGPAAWWHGWTPTDRDIHDKIAGAMATGHVIKCGPQATGGNCAFFEEVTDRRYPGFLIAEVEADGSSVITKHAGTGGLVSVGTVTAQLLYEIGDPAYLGPDAVAHFDTLSLTQQGEHRVRIDGVRGSSPSDQLKVALNYEGGCRNSMTLVLTGTKIEEKAAWAEAQLVELLGGRDRFAEFDAQLVRFDHPDAATNAEATAHLRITVKDPDRGKVGRAFSNATMEILLAGYPGAHTATPPSGESAFGIYWPTLVPAAEVHHRVTLPDGTVCAVPHRRGDTPATAPAVPPPLVAPGGPTRRVPLGTIAGARSGDKGGNANIGFWTRTDTEYAWLREYLGIERLRSLLPEAAELEIHRYELPNLRALNFVVVGILGAGVASAVRPDPQAKGLGEYLRSRLVDVPESLLPD